LFSILAGDYTYLRPITVAACSEALTVFARSNTGIMGSNLTWGMDVCLRLFCVCVVLCVRSPCDGLIPRTRSPINCVEDEATEKVAKAQQRAVEP
jgi:hypothetical protein